MPFNASDEPAFLKLDAAGKQQWFSENVPSAYMEDQRSRARYSPEPFDGFNMLWELARPGFGRTAPENTDWPAHFGRLSPEAQLKFFLGWQNRDKAAEPHEADPKFASPAQNYVTLPDGSQHSEAWDEVDPDYESSDGRRPERWSMPRFGLTRPVLVFGMGGIIGLVLAGGLYLTLTGDDKTDTGPAGPEESLPSGSNEWSTDDPFGDFEQSDPFDSIDRTRERGGENAGEFQDAVDVVEVAVSASAEGTLVTVTHAGDAQAKQASPEGDVSIAIVIVLSDGTRWEVISKDDGKTWEDERVIGGDAENDYGYPSVTYVDDLAIVRRGTELK